MTFHIIISVNDDIIIKMAFNATVGDWFWTFTEKHPKFFSKDYYII